MQYLTPGLMELYVDIESTGRDSQFYDKFNVRYQIACLFRYLWKIPFHRTIIIERAKAKFLFLASLFSILLTWCCVFRTGITSIDSSTCSSMMRLTY